MLIKKRKCFSKNNKVVKIVIANKFCPMDYVLLEIDYYRYSSSVETKIHQFKLN